ncbi:MAG: CHAT domain-containing protein [Anaerolineaceae bacterium]|nr:CHAT domain-containing protein [Anaerolineaceae bacterium]
MKINKILIASLFAVFTSIFTNGFSQIELVDSETEIDWPLVLVDSFDTNKNNWFTGQEDYQNSEGLFQISNGKYEWQLKAIQDYAGYFQVASSAPLTDFYLSVETKQVSGAEVSDAGVLFRIDSDWNYYRFDICAQCQSFAVWMHKDGEWEDLIEWKTSSQIKPFGVNQIEVLGEGSHFIFSINGQVVDEIDDLRIPTGIIGLGGSVFGEGKSVIFEFDNFELRAPEQENQIPEWWGFLNDDFENNDNGWFEGSIDNIQATGDAKIGNGKYIWDLNAWVEHKHEESPDIGAFSDFYVSADTKRVEGSVDTTLGLNFRLDDSWYGFRNQYLFVYHDEYQEFSVWKLFNDDWISLVDWRFSSVIIPGGVNNLAVLAEGTHFDFFINGQKVGEADDESINFGSVGLVAEIYNEGENAVFEFDNFEILLKPGLDTTLQKGYDFLAEGDIPAANDQFMEAIENLQKNGNHVGGVNLLKSLAITFNRRHEFDQALKYLLIAEESVGNLSDQETEAELLEFIAEIYGTKANYRNDIEYMTRAAKIWQTLGNDWRYAEAIHQIGIGYFDLSEFEQGMIFTKQALDMRKNWSGIYNKQNIARGYNNLANFYSLLGEHDQALEYYQKAVAICEEINDYSIRPAIFISNIGKLYLDLGEYELSLENNFKAREIFESIEPIHPNYYYYRSGNLLYIAETYMKMEEANEALDYLDLAWEFIKPLNLIRTEADVNFQYGEVYRLLGDLTESITYFESALAVYQEIGDKKAISETLDQIGQIQEELGNDDEALSYFLDSISELESYLSSFQSEAFKSAFSGSSVEIYQRAARLLVEQGRYEEAFAISERNRSRVFLEGMGSKRPDLRETDDMELLREEELLRGEISALETQLSDEKSAALENRNLDLIESTKSQLDTKQVAYQDLLTRIQLANPELASLVAIPETTVQSVQKTLDEKTVLVSYYLTDSDALAFIISKDHFEVVVLPASSEEIGEAVTAFRGLGMSNLNNTHPRSLINLYEWLVDPITPFISETLVGIIPHQALHYIPFGALTDGDNFFGEQHVLYYLPSASTLPFIQEKLGREVNMPLVLGDPTTGNSELPMLEYAVEEAQHVAELFDVKANLRDEATEEILIAQSGDAGILHLASHGTFNAYAPLFSRLWLTSSDSYDGNLNVYEIYGLDLSKTAMVILSACQTQIGEISGGDEVVGLNRAFLYGSPTVIASLWSVDDEATGFLMENFYRNILEGKGKAAALNAAQEAVRNNAEHLEWQHPYYWAAFVLNGDPGVTTEQLIPEKQNTSDKTILLIAGLIGLLLLVIVVIIIFRKKRAVNK